jgi:hypothetical protein
MIAVLQNPIFQDETKAREWLEARQAPSARYARFFDPMNCIQFY